MTFATTVNEPYCPLRAVKRSDLRGKPKAFGDEPSSEGENETIDSSLENGSEPQGLEPDYTIEIESFAESVPKTLTEAAERLGLAGCQSATNRLNKLATRFPLDLLKDGKRLTPLGWELMQRLGNESVEELWDELKVIAEPEPATTVVEAEVMDPDEVAAAIVLRTEAVLATIGEAEIPTVDFSANLEQLLAYAAAAGSQTGQKLGVAYQTAMAEAFQSVVAQGQLGGTQ